MKAQVTLNIGSNNKEAREKVVSMLCRMLTENRVQTILEGKEKIEVFVHVNDNNPDQATMKLNQNNKL